MAPRTRIVTGAVLAALAVALGAFGAHALEGHLTPQRMATWDTAARMHLVHAVALVALGAAGDRVSGVGPALLLAGTVVFSGTLYALCLTGVGVLGAITPIGGVSLVAGWVMIAVAAGRGT